MTFRIVVEWTVNVTILNSHVDYFFSQLVKCWVGPTKDKAIQQLMHHLLKY